MSTFTSAWYWSQIPVLPTPDDLRARFAEHHQPIAAPVLAAASSDDLAAWHRGEHAQRHPGKRELPHGGHLRHTHKAAA